MIGTLNATAATLALGLAVLAGVEWSPSSSQRPKSAPTRSAGVVYKEIGDGKKGLADASGRVFPIKEYSRIVSGSMVSDALLLNLASPDRIASYTLHSEKSALGSYRYGDKPRLNPLDNLETILSLKPDLILLGSHGSPSKIARLGESGVSVFNLGQMQGLQTYLKNARAVAALLGHAERGERYAREFEAQMNGVARGVPEEGRKSAVYLVIFSGKIFGGGRETSYDDVIRSAGLLNRAAKKYSGWPEYDAEQLLELNPDLLVTREGMRSIVCRHPGLSELRACQDAVNAIIELPAAIISDPGAGMLPAAQMLREAVYGPITRP